MIWIEDLSQLSYLTTPSWADCYCELITEPSDMLLQAYLNHPLLSYPNGETYNVSIQVLTPDGQTVLEDVSDMFEWYVFIGNNGYYCNLRLLRVTDIMCANKCFILHVLINREQHQGDFTFDIKMFEAYTERYCIDNCCLLPSNISITQNYIPT